MIDAHATITDYDTILLVCLASPLEKSANLASGLGTHLLSTIDYDSK